jgi:hypothetical protein
LDLQEKSAKVVLAKLDASMYKSIASRFDVKGFPTLKWFSNGEPSEYTGGRTDRAIVSWVQKNLGPATKHLSAPAEHEAFVASADVVVVGYFKDTKSHQWQRFLTAAQDIHSVAFAHADSLDVQTHAGQKDGTVVLHKKFDGGLKTVFEGELSTQALQARHAAWRSNAPLYHPSPIRPAPVLPDHLHRFPPPPPPHRCYPPSVHPPLAARGAARPASLACRPPPAPPPSL